MVRNGGGKEIVFLNLPIGCQFHHYQMNKNKITYMKILKKILNIFSKNSSTTKTDTPQFIDLGLPSGLKWAKCNVGATSETDYGYYFQWGSTTPNIECNWKSYKHCKAFNLRRYTLTKYCTDSLYGTVDNKTTLDPEDDAATQIMGGKWRMPTIAEISELWDNTNSEWVEDYNGTKINGMKFTSKINGNSIFIPAAGTCFDGSVGYVGYDGNVWSSSLYASNPTNAWDLYFNSGDCYMYYNYRCNGRSVRGVRK